MKHHKPKVPINIDIENITTSEVEEYLNYILYYYGPPCDWCLHFTGHYLKQKRRCQKGHKPRIYLLEAGPYAKWMIRKKCRDFDEKCAETSGSSMSEAIDKALSCDTQQYG